eukprot:CAMPEP_0197829402 /NCGR_PEP_ID=MMETSP1437-20131217/5845_1 /TAXON_ID=49252 ORGANISM="Eucampia antarctica, Strain CCMP1452" /NCGR_SAMPLE_ID=MMETSP1437 /ASSEMBLY_ACC=CAM_ASM_001096 /LENGTH=456 /DNA_ID=CAMNT_0043431041 /DNA_START=61 /DNA_END=1428 /DNA_ORIENTATION=+
MTRWIILKVVTTISLLLGSNAYALTAMSFSRAKDNALQQITSLVLAPVQFVLPTEEDGDGDNENSQMVMDVIESSSIESALQTLERDVLLLDSVADDQRNQLSLWEFLCLGLAVTTAAAAPIMFPDSPRLVEVVAPATAAFSASIGIGAEYTGKVAVANGKEVAAAAIICAAESEGWLARAERIKAITPLCVGIAATSAAFAIVFPQLTVLPLELYLLSPLVAVLSAAVASLATTECSNMARTAMSVGNRRFAKSGTVGRTWLSVSEQIDRTSNSLIDRWKYFIFACIPAPVIGSCIPTADLPTKAIIISSIAAAQAAYFMAQAEYTVAKATDSVALKAKSAAISDTYANLSAKSAAILPFTSALSSASAAAAAALVELIPLHTLPLFWECTIVSVFPLVSSIFAAAASVSKERSVVDTEAAMQAAATLSLDYDNSNDVDDNNPIQIVLALIQTSW